MSMEKYKNIIDLPHHVSLTRKRMPMEDRASQFSPFAALTGHEAAIKETARLTETFIDLGEDDKEVLNQKMLRLIENVNARPKITITYFIPDHAKEGGKYVMVTANVVKIRTHDRTLELSGNILVAFDYVSDIIIEE